MITHGSKKRKRQSVDVNTASKRQRKSSASQSTDTSGDVNENDELPETMAPPSVKKKKKRKHVKDSDFSSDSGIDFLPSPEGVVDACHLKHGKHKKSKARHNNDSSVAEDECFADNDDSVKEESIANSHEQSVVSGMNYSDQDTIAGLTQASQSVPRKKKHKKLKKVKTEPEWMLCSSARIWSWSELLHKFYCHLRHSICIVQPTNYYHCTLRHLCCI